MRRLFAVLVVATLLVGCDDDVTDVTPIVLDAPATLTSISLNGAIHLSWSDNSYANAPAGSFLEYRVYSTGYSLDEDLCDATWDFEGSSVFGTEFLVGALTNGSPRCFGVVAVSVDGVESDWSPLRADTPRPDARNVLIFAFQASPGSSGFRFFQDVNGDGQVGALELGAVGDGSRTDIDFYVHRDPDGTFFLIPERVGTGVALYSAGPIEDLTSIDIAPESEQFSRDGIEALPRFGYVFEMDGGDGYARYGAIRVTHVGTDYMIFDWSYQTDPGNPELSVHGGAAVSNATGITVTRGRK
jgi:hypothetical protein